MHIAPYANRIAWMRSARVVMPSRLFAITYCAYFLGWLLIPMEPVFDASWESGLFLLLCVFALGFSLSMGEKLLAPNPRGSFEINTIDWRKFSIFIHSLAFFGICLSVIDRFYFRGVDLSQNAFEAREAIEGAGSGVVGMLAAFFSSFAMFGLLANWIASLFGFKLKLHWKWLGYINILVMLGLTVLLGSRSLVLVAIVVHVLAFFWLRKLQGKRVSIGAICIALLLVLALIGWLAYVFQERLSLMGLSALESIQISGYAFTLQPSNAVLSFMRQNDVPEEFSAAVYSLVLYVYHGAFEFLLLHESYSGDYQYGGLLLWLPIKIISTLFGLGFQAGVGLDAFGYRYGIFTGIFGPMFVDFGSGAPIALAMVGMLLAFSFTRLRAGRTQWVFPTLIGGVLVIFSPILSLLQSATGAYLFLISLILVTVSRFFRLKNN